MQEIILIFAIFAGLACLIGTFARAVLLPTAKLGQRARGFSDQVVTEIAVALPLGERACEHERDGSVEPDLDRVARRAAAQVGGVRSGERQAEPGHLWPAPAPRLLLRFVWSPFFRFVPSGSP